MGFEDVGKVGGTGRKDIKEMRDESPPEDVQTKGHFTQDK